MKIIKEGRGFKKEPFIVNCYRCDAEISFILDEMPADSEGKRYITCPHCQNKIYVHESVYLEAREKIYDNDSHISDINLEELHELDKTKILLARPNEPNPFIGVIQE